MLYREYKNKIKADSYKSLLIFFSASMLASCGGGGGSSSHSHDNNGPATGATTEISGPALPDNNASVLQCPTTSAYSLASPPAQNSGQIVGRITYERVPFFMSPGSTPGGPGLDYNSPQILPARGVV